MEYLIANPEVCQRLGRAARKRVEEICDQKKLDQELVEIYQELIKT
jgi:glycosyltransferase involved in cell wall biosynthesis